MYVSSTCAGQPDYGFQNIQLNKEKKLFVLTFAYIMTGYLFCAMSAGTYKAPTWVYRITHYQNLEYILQHGMYSKKHPNFDQNYVGIGNKSLISSRDGYPVGITGKGTLGDYVPFYFGRLSVMLLNIKTGYSGVTKLPQNDILYICCKISDILQKGLPIVFTDGHAYDANTIFFDNPADFNQLYWDVIRARHWQNTPEDNQRQRKKQAEFLVHGSVPADCISAIVVYDQEKHDYAAAIVQRLGINIKIHIKPADFYY